VSRTQIIYIVVGSCAVFGLVAWAGMILVPAWTAYNRWWEKLVATALSLYVALTMTGVGIFLGVIVVPHLWDKLHS
jgi:ABC-type iron transport system FetAB permease component